jgi:hypothetical protein
MADANLPRIVTPPITVKSGPLPQASLESVEPSSSPVNIQELPLTQRSQSDIASLTPATRTNQIRNILQTAAERDIVKTAPDIVVYIEGRPYLINYFINSQDAKNQSDGNYTIVNFNDFIDSFAVSYDVDNLIPSGSISMFVPNNFKRLFQAPAGGENILETMMEVQVFAKGYFPSPRGNTLYYRVFKGMISNIVYNDMGTHLAISISIAGTMRFLELMQIDLAPAITSNSPQNYLTAFQNSMAGMDPYKQLADVFMRSVTPAGFQLNSIQQATLKTGQANTSDWAKVVHDDYILRWQARLVNIVRDVRILGYDMKHSPITTTQDPYLLPNVLSIQEADAKGNLDPDLIRQRGDRMTKEAPGKTRSDPNMFINIMRRYLPDMQIGSIKLLDGKITSRIDRIRVLLNLILFEGFQDMDGAIVFKPPFYNLDVTNVGNLNPNTPAPNASYYFTDTTNPFVVYLSEIESETETEDEHGIKATRVAFRGDWLTNFHFNSETGATLMPTVDHIDIAKLIKFGLREEPARQIPFVQSNDTKTLYAYATSELNRANRSYRTYSITIPLRPELHLGFPMYFPHKDMYGYIKSISINYQQSSAATMSVTLDTIRKRPMIPSVRTVGNKHLTSYTSQPNLVFQWTTPPASTVGAVNPPNWASQNAVQPSTGLGAGGNNSNSSQVALNGNTVTGRQPQDTPFSSDEWAYIKHQKETIGNLWSTRFDTLNKCFRIQNDSASSSDVSEYNKIAAANGGMIPMTANKPYFDAKYWLPKGINSAYYHKILNTQPYTDEKGYELVSPFPWGRWATLTDAFNQSRLGILTNYAASSFGIASANTTVNTFLFAGMVSPDDPSIAGQMLASFPTPTPNSFTPEENAAIANGAETASQAAQNKIVNSLFDTVTQDAVIELVTPQPNYPGTDSSLTQNLQPDLQQAQTALTGDLATIQNEVSVFITGGVGTSNTQNIKQLSGTTVNPKTPTPSLPPFLKKALNGGNS